MRKPQKFALKIAISALSLLGMASGANASAVPNSYLVKLRNPNFRVAAILGESTETKPVLGNWIEVTVHDHVANALQKLRKAEDIEYAQLNYKQVLLEDYRLHDPLQREALQRLSRQKPELFDHQKVPQDNPPIPTIGPVVQGGNDPLNAKQWGMIDIGTKDAWSVTMGSPDIIVAVIDTGVDYTHEDLAGNIWHNPNPGTGGYTDDVIGWDFVDNDNKPYDMAATTLQILTTGGNPGHGTHCAGNVAAMQGNNLGVAGVAPHVKIMPLRFISTKGEGTTADAIKAIKYAVDHGARVLSNSWGSEGDDPAEATENQALKDAIQYAQDHNVLFIAAAGNGHNGIGYDNDTDPKPGVPASYDNDNIISVAAIDSANNLGVFSNWGAKTVDIAAPGVAVFSTVVQKEKYSDTVVDFMGVKATWDGTSMATPHVAGAAALYWSAHPEKSYSEVKAAILNSATPLDNLKGKMVSGGKLNVKDLLLKN